MSSALLKRALALFEDDEKGPKKNRSANNAPVTGGGKKRQKPTKIVPKSHDDVRLLRKVSNQEKKTRAMIDQLKSEDCDANVEKNVKQLQMLNALTSRYSRALVQNRVTKKRLLPSEAGFIKIKGDKPSPFESVFSEADFKRFEFEYGLRKKGKSFKYKKAVF